MGAEVPGVFLGCNTSKEYAWHFDSDSAKDLYTLVSNHYSHAPTQKPV